MARPPPSLSAAPPQATEPLAWLGLALLLIPWLLRATTNSTTFPAWDLDPLSYSVFSTSLTPVGSILCDGASVFGSALLLAGSARRGTPLNIPLVLLALIGATAIVLHGWVLGPAQGSLGNQRIGAAWLSAVLGALALWHAAQDLSIRRIATGSLLGLVALLALYGAVQVFWTHPQTIADFKANPDRLLAAHGWARDSSMAKSFIRRLEQPEAIGWFGLANVYATIAAAAAVGGIGLLVATFRARPKRVALLRAFGASAGLALALSYSKGGIIAGAVGVVALAALHILSRTDRLSTNAKRRAAGLVGLSAIAGPIALIILRGQIGERLHELSLLFRWFYIQAACRIFAEHPVIGVGPDGFQRAFTIAKPPLCPEEVSSPHGVVFDWTATLGVLGIAWACVLGRLAWRACADAVTAPRGSPGGVSPPLSRPDTRVLFAIPVVATVLGAFIESALVTPEVALTRMVGVVLWCGAAWAIARALDRTAASRIALAGAALVLIAHGQIDVAGSLPSSVGLWFGLIALAAAPDPVPGGSGKTRLTVPHIAVAAVLAAIALLVLGTSLRTVRAWERQLNLAADAVRPIAEIAERFSSLSASSTAGDSPQAIARDLERLLGHPIDPSEDGFRRGMTELERRLLPLASDGLEAAFQIEPSDRHPLREASRLHLRLAGQAMEAANEQDARRELDRAVEVMRMSAGSSEPAATDWHWLASAHEHAADLLHDPSHIRLAISARIEVAALDPYNLENAKRLLRDFLAMNDLAQAKAWATRCLELDQYMRLDRETRGLSPDELKDITAIVKAPG